MKNLITILMMLVMVFAFTGCGQNEISEDNASLGNDNKITSNEGEKSTTNITLEDVMNHEESPASDFFCNDDGNGGLIILEYLGKSDIVVIPETINGKNVTKINKFVFSNSSPVKGIKLSNTVKEIGEGAFTLNSNLQYVVCGSGLEVIEETAFFYCSSLKNFEMDEGLKIIENQAFSGCTSLKSITVPSSVETIEVIAFNMMSDDFKIIGAVGSVAETYAKENNIPFEEM